MCLLVSLFAISFGLSRDYWSNATLLIAYFWQIEFLAVMLTVAFIPIAMRLCDPRVAATQFTLYMAASNVGRPIGNSVAGATDEMGAPYLMYFIVAGVFAAVSLILWFARFPTKAPEAVKIIEESEPVVAGEPAPKID